ncbi:MAG: dUTP diphosphatase [Oscillospiraceae bacterium]|nr:dUTP diphosphatase [Oscillospiraceae bacterium]
MKVIYKKLVPEAVVPSYGTPGSAGADIYALADREITVRPGETVLIHTGIALEIPEGYVGMVCARSGLALKRDLAPANKVGIIDSDYRGELMVPLHNHGKDEQTITPFERIAQLIVAPYVTAEFAEAEELKDTERGKGGFGSTGRS